MSAKHIKTTSIRAKKRVGRVGFEDFFHLGQHVGSLLSSHHRDASIRPHEEEAGGVRPTAHAVVPRSVASADDAGYLGHVRAGDGRHELGAVFGDALVLVPLSNLRLAGGGYSF